MDGEMERGEEADPLSHAVGGGLGPLQFVFPLQDPPPPPSRLPSSSSFDRRSAPQGLVT